jgi:ubiquitin carboxyl-terminal hydrolase 22/27/51
MGSNTRRNEAAEAWYRIIYRQVYLLDLLS